MIEFDVAGLASLVQRMKQAPERAEMAAQRAINDTADFARRSISKRAREQLNFKRSDLTEKGNKLGVRKRASRGDLEALVVGSERPTSLGRFSTKRLRRGMRGITVKVKRGSSNKLDRGFALPLRRGNFFDPLNPNMGLAVRLKKGEKLSNSVGAINMGGGLYLLYGPAIDQIFESYVGDELDQVAAKLEAEFNRQWNLLQ